MTDAAEKLSTAAQKLSRAERLAVVDAILGSLDAADPALDALWAAEAEDRLAAYRRGEIRAVALSDMLSKYRNACAPAREPLRDE